MQQVLSIGVDIGGSHISAAAVLRKGVLLLEDTLTTRPVNSTGTAKEILTTWANCINEVIQKATSAGPINGIGIAMPGAFNYREGIALFEDTDKYNALYGLNIHTALMPLLDHPIEKIRFINDAAAFALGSLHKSTLTQETTHLAIVLGTGFGTALTRSGLPLTAGNKVPEHGCFWHLPYREGIADDYFSTRWFITEYEKLSGNTVDGVKAIADAYAADRNARLVFHRFGENLGEFLQDWVRELTITSITFGGKISKALNYFLHPLSEKLKSEHPSLMYHQNHLLDKATILGGSKLTEDDFWIQIKEQLPMK